VQRPERSVAAGRPSFRVHIRGDIQAAHDRQGAEQGHSVVSMTDLEWPKRKKAFETWLEPSNFELDGTQKTSLSTLDGLV
jgi:hypothetical protein